MAERLDRPVHLTAFEVKLPCVAVDDGCVYMHVGNLGHVVQQDQVILQRLVLVAQGVIRRRHRPHGLEHGPVLSAVRRPLRAQGLVQQPQRLLRPVIVGQEASQLVHRVALHIIIVREILDELKLLLKDGDGLVHVVQVQVRGGGRVQCHHVILVVNDDASVRLPREGHVLQVLVDVVQGQAVVLHGHEERRLVYQTGVVLPQAPIGVRQFEERVVLLQRWVPLPRPCVADGERPVTLD
mmetsp:Transcript_35338/g.75437  ORF Transcript_35338/g.75437 Transcript_35338/m.75437 type:complete len:239 (-) Transcript_35338:1325-2041(-)